MGGTSPRKMLGRCLTLVAVVAVVTALPRADQWDEQLEEMQLEGKGGRCWGALEIANPSTGARTISFAKRAFVGTAGKAAAAKARSDAMLRSRSFQLAAGSYCCMNDVARIAHLQVGRDRISPSDFRTGRCVGRTADKAGKNASPTQQSNCS